jgi:spermidine synthase
MKATLLLSVFLIAVCGLLFQLVAGALASYLIGDTVTQFSLVIGIFLSSMGLGSFLSRYFENKLLRVFVQIEILLAIIGGISTPILFYAFLHTPIFRPLFFVFTSLIGTLVGLEIPLLIRILEKETRFTDAIAQVLALDYVGGLFASLLFPFALGPKIGLVNCSIIAGLVNATVAFISCSYFSEEAKKESQFRLLQFQSFFALTFLGILYFQSSNIMNFLEKS